MMSTKVAQTFLRSLLLLTITVLVSANARPQQFAETSQVNSDQESNNLLETSLNNLRPWQLELLAQRLNEYNQAAAAAVPAEYAWDKALRSPEMKRQSRYRQCYFNPISCFRK